jgi:hypothetical protein
MIRAGLLSASLTHAMFNTFATIAMELVTALGMRASP